MPNHVHLLIKLKPTNAISNFLRQLKTNSSKWINETHSTTDKFHWQDGYAIFSVSQSQSLVVAKYIQNQAEHHRRKPYQEELLMLLKKNGIEFDERYVWD